MKMYCFFFLRKTQNKTKMFVVLKKGGKCYNFFTFYDEEFTHGTGGKK